MALYTVDRNTITTRVAGQLQTLDRTFLQIQQLNTFLLTIPDATLTSLYGFVQADVNVLRSALNDIEQLRTIYQGSVNLPTAKDFRTFAGQAYPYGSI